MDKAVLQLLLVEDNATDVLLLEEALEEVPSLKHTLTHVTRLDDALKCLAASHFDAVFLDPGLPDSQGLETFARMQRQHSTTPILLLSGLDDQTVAVKAVQDGAQDYLVKGQISGVLLARTICYAIERKSSEAALRASEARYRRIVETAQEGIWLFDKEYRTTYVNHQMAAMLGSTETEMIGLSPLSFVFAEDRADLEAKLQDSQRGHCSQFDSRYRCRDGAVVWLLASTQPILEEGVFVGAFGMFTDITTRQEMAEALRRSHDDLEARVVERTTELQGSYCRLQELEKLRDDLTHMIIHDLRTPLTSVILGMESVPEMGELNRAQQEVMKIALRGADTLKALINDLLDVDKMESGSMQLDFAALSAADLISSAICQVATLIESKNLILVRQVARDLPSFHGDEDKLRRTLVNLLGNAIKFTPGGGTLTITARQADGEPGVLFSIRDTGEGIPFDAQERIFDKFGQVESRQGGQTMSTGLGLTFCKLTVESHGGHIAVHSTPGQGSEFYFTIPRQPASARTGLIVANA